MGVNNLWRLLLPIGRRISIETLTGKTLAIDSSIWITQFLKAIREDDSDTAAWFESSTSKSPHLLGFARRICKLLFNGIRPVFVFDGATPEIKKRELRERSRRRQKLVKDGETEDLKRTARRILAAELKSGKRGGVVAGSDVPPLTITDDTGGHPAVAMNQMIHIADDDHNEEAGEEGGHDYFNRGSEPPSTKPTDLTASSSDEEVDIDRLVSLPSTERSAFFTKAKVKLRLQSRKEFLPAAADPIAYSSIQLRNFLKSTRLNKNMRDSAVASNKINKGDDAEGEEETVGVRMASNPSVRLLLEKDKEEKDHESNGSPQRLWTRLKSNRQDNDDHEDDHIFEDCTKKVQFIDDDDDDDKDEGGFMNDDDDKDEGGFMNDDDEDVGEGGFMNNDDENVGEGGFMNDDDDKDKGGFMNGDIGDIGEGGFMNDDEGGFMGDDEEGFMNDVEGGFMDDDVEILGTVKAKSTPIPNKANIKKNEENKGMSPHGNTWNHDQLTQELQIKDDELLAEQIQRDQLLAIQDVSHDEQKQEHKPISYSEDNCNALKDVEKVQRDQLLTIQDLSDDEQKLEHQPNQNNTEEIDSSEEEDDVDWEDGCEEIEDDVVVHADREDGQVSATMEVESVIAPPCSKTEAEPPPDTDSDISTAEALFSSDSSPFQSHSKKKSSPSQSPSQKRSSPFQSPNKKRSSPNAKQTLTTIGHDTATTAVVLQQAQKTASNLTSWAGRAVRRAIAEHMGDAVIPTGDECNATQIADVKEEDDSHEDTISSFHNSTDENDDAVPSTATTTTQHESNRHQDRDTNEQYLQPRTGQEEILFQALNQPQDQHPQGKTFADEIPMEEMKQDIIHLLQLFGIPYVNSPAEAESQCVTLESLNLVDGIITEDSDAFVFGGERIYRNIFCDQKYVEVYTASDATREFHLDRERMVVLAMLLGGDYTEGVKGVGIVNGMEILRAFFWEEDELGEGASAAVGEAGLMERLEGFKKWLDGFDPLMEGSSSSPLLRDQQLTRQQVFHKKHRSARTRWIPPSGFPSSSVMKAYLNPVVDSSKAKLTWGNPDLDGLRRLFSDRMRWSSAETDNLLLPVIKKMEENGGFGGVRQTRIDSYFMTYNDNIKFANVRSKRLLDVIKDVKHEINYDRTEKPNYDDTSKNKGGDHEEEGLPVETHNAAKGGKRPASRAKKTGTRASKRRKT